MKKILIIAFTLVIAFSFSIIGFAMETEEGVFTYERAQTVTFSTSEGATATGTNFSVNADRITFSNNFFGSIDKYSIVEMRTQGAGNRLWILSGGYYTFDFYVDIVIREINNSVSSYYPINQLAYFMIDSEGYQYTFYAESIERFSNYDRFVFSQTIEIDHNVDIVRAGVFFPSPQGLDGLISWQVSLYSINYKLEYEVTGPYIPVIESSTDKIIFGDWSDEQHREIMEMEYKNELVELLEKELARQAFERFSSAEYIYRDALSFMSLFYNAFAVFRDLFTYGLSVTHLGGVIAVGISVGLTGALFGITLKAVTSKGGKDE